MNKSISPTVLTGSEVYHLLHISCLAWAGIPVSSSSQSAGTGTHVVLAVKLQHTAAVYTTPPWSRFESPIARPPRGCQINTERRCYTSSESSRRRVPTPTSLVPPLLVMYSSCGDIDHGTSPEGCVIYAVLVHGKAVSGLDFTPSYHGIT